VVTIEQGGRVAFFGSFTYKSNVTGKEVTSPLSLLTRFEWWDDRVAISQMGEKAEDLMSHGSGAGDL
jgi:hypothetical protein